jgi:hypothetical protein
MDAVPKFSIKDLLIATIFVAVGLGMVTSIFKSSVYFHGTEYGAPFLWFGGCALIGLGLGWPFKQPLVGIFLGFLISIITPLLVLLIFDLDR